MRQICKIPGMTAALAIAILLGNTPAASAEDDSPSAEDMRGAMMQLLKLDELLNKEPQPLKHTKVGDETADGQPQSAAKQTQTSSSTLPQVPRPPQVDVPAVPGVKKPAPAPAKPAIMVKTAGADQAEKGKTMPSPVNPGAKGIPAQAKGPIKAAKPAQTTAPQGEAGDSSGSKGPGNALKGLLPDFQKDLTKPKPKSKIKRVSKPKPDAPESTD